MFDHKTGLLGYLALLITPLFFSSNLIFGREAASLDPFILTFLRWSIAGSILLLFNAGNWRQIRDLVKNNGIYLLVCAFLSIWICGAMVYLALKHTTAIHGTVIYTISPIFVLLLSTVFLRANITWRTIVGAGLAMFGVLLIVSQGSYNNLAFDKLNLGDLLFLLAAFAWAIYTLLLKSPRLEGYPASMLIGVIGVLGAFLLLPFAAWAFFHSANYPNHLEQWWIISGLVFVASIVPFSSFRLGISIHGPNIAAIFMYLLTPFGLLLAWIFLDEVPTLTAYIGAGMVVTGVITATLVFRPKDRSNNPNVSE